VNARALIPIFYVANVDVSSEFYTRILGFMQAFRYGTYAGFRLGEQEIHITDPGEPRHIVGAGSAYVICDEVDRYFEQIASLGAIARSAPQDRVYGMRDFAVLDPDGNQLTFGCSTEEAKAC
jgi:catechol 2,3-dioxygenase-like lactoylglutathione lyase family enzyme